MLLHGEETFLVERALGLVRSRAAADDPGRAWRTVWGDDDADRLGAALAAVGTPQLFGGAPALVVRRAEALSAALEDRILALLPRLDRPAQLVLVARTADQRKRFVQQLVREKMAFGFPRAGDAGVARRWVGKLARELGIEVGPPAVDLLVERYAGDLGVLATELDKAALHAGPGRPVGADDVEATGILARTAAVEQLTDRLAQRDLAGAMRALRGVLDAGEAPLRVSAFLAANLRRLLHVAELRESGLDAEAIAGRLGMPPWLVRKQMGRGRAADLETALLVLRGLDADLKSSRPDDAAFEAALLRIGTGAR